jgi:hypothetical protein
MEDHSFDVDGLLPSSFVLIGFDHARSAGGPIGSPFVNPVHIAAGNLVSGVHWTWATCY